MRPKTTWILIADGARARIAVNRGPGKGLKAALDHDFAASHAPTRAFTSDKPGRGFERADGARHGVGPRVDWHTFEKHLFAESMAQVLDAAAQARTFDRLILVAPPKTLGALRQALKTRTRDMVTGEVGKDLTHVPLHRLAGYLQGVLAL